jgi:protein TonB
MANKSRKTISWTLSLAIHAVGLTMILVAGFHIATPEGTVTDKTEFDAVDFTPTAPKPEQATNPAPPQPPPAAQIAPPAPFHEQEKPVAEAPVEAPLTDATADEAPALPKEAVIQHDTEARPLEEGEHQEAAASEDPAQEPQASAPAAAAQAEATPSEPAPVASAAPEVAAPQTTAAAPAQPSEPAQVAGNPPTEGVPAYGTPGTTLDESKLTEAFGNHKPSYPWMARLRRQQGTVVIRAFIKKDGTIEQATVDQSSGSSLIDQEALASYGRWKYKPGLSGWVLKPFKFSLK